MIYTCDTKCCHFIFFSVALKPASVRIAANTASGRPHSRNAAFFRRQIEFAQEHPTG